MRVRQASCGLSGIPPRHASWPYGTASFLKDGRDVNQPAAERGELRWHPRGLNNGLVFGATCRGVARLPPSLSYGIGRAGTWLAYHLMRGSTAAVIDNLRLPFPDRSELDLRRLALRTYRSYAKDTIDFIRSLSMSVSELEGLVREFRTGQFDRVLAAGRGALAVSAHFGNWELGGLLLRRLHSYPVSIVVRAELSPAVNKTRNRFRASVGIDTIEVRRHVDTALEIRRLLGENRIVAMLLDRYLDKDRVRVEFFGRSAYFLRTPALMGYLTGAPLVPSFVYTREDGYVAAVCGEPIIVGQQGDREASIQRATQEFAQVLEVQIRERPYCWYQFYPFWATQPNAGQTHEPLERRYPSGRLRQI